MPHLRCHGDSVTRDSSQPSAKTSIARPSIRATTEENRRLGQAKRTGTKNKRAKHRIQTPTKKGEPKLGVKVDRGAAAAAALGGQKVVPGVSGRVGGRGVLEKGMRLPHQGHIHGRCGRDYGAAGCWVGVGGKRRAGTCQNTQKKATAWRVDADWNRGNTTTPANHW